MKCFKRIYNLLALVAVLATAQTSLGGESSGGTQFVVLKDDSVVLADPFVQKEAGTCELGADLKEEINRAGTLLVRYGATIAKAYYGGTPLPFQYSEFVNSEVLGDHIEYRCVDQFPDYVLRDCHAQERLVGLPKASRTVKGACTSGPVTWLNKKLFAKMTLREQAKTIIHERLHSKRFKNLSPELAHQFISDLTNGLEVTLTLYNDQVVKGSRLPLSDEQISTIKLMIKRIIQLGMSKNRYRDPNDLLNDWVVVRNGGGLFRFHEDRIEGFLSVGSAIQNGDAEKGSEIIDTFCAPFNFDNEVFCYASKNSQVKSLRIGMADGIKAQVHVSVNQGVLEDSLIVTSKPNVSVSVLGGRMKNTYLENVSTFTILPGASSSGVFLDGSDRFKPDNFIGVTLERGASITQTDTGGGTWYTVPKSKFAGFFDRDPFIHVRIEEKVAIDLGKICPDILHQPTFDDYTEVKKPEDLTKACKFIERN